jgi:hypothetical protein
MKKRSAIVFMILGIAIGLFCIQAFGAENFKLAVVDFGISEIPEETSQNFTQKFRDTLSQNQSLNILTRAEVETSFDKIDLLSKSKLEQVDCQDVSCAARVGTTLNVDKVIIGRIIKDKKQGYVIWAKLVDVSKRDVEFTASVEGVLGADLNQLAISLGQKVIDWLPKPGESEGTVRNRRLSQEKAEEDAKQREQEELLKKLAYRKPGTCPQGMVLVPAGEFTMGSKDNPKKVKVDEFCIDVYEFPNQKGELPFRKAEWFAAKEECKAQGKRLCTEAEWEKACKGTKGFMYPYGDQPEQRKCNTATLEENKLIKNQVAQCGTYKECVNDYGIYDMSGNMWEWTADYYDPNIKTFVLRGGSHNVVTDKSSCTNRLGAIPFMGRKDTGFRCCK